MYVNKASMFFWYLFRPYTVLAPFEGGKGQGPYSLNGRVITWYLRV